VRQTPRSDGVIFGVKFDAEPGTPEHLCREQRGAGTAERVKHEIVGQRKSFNEGFQNTERLLRRMKPVVSVGFPRNDIADGSERSVGLPFARR
jgi:hypothetical protein